MNEYENMSAEEMRYITNGNHVQQNLNQLKPVFLQIKSAAKRGIGFVHCQLLSTSHIHTLRGLGYSVEPLSKRHNIYYIISW